jgi:NADH dehydrogenase
MTRSSASTFPRVVIVGGGFAGLNAARELGKRKFPVTLVDRRNFHLFQPLLYQLATGYLASGDIAAPLRSTLARYSSLEVLLETVQDIDPERKTVITGSFRLDYDILIVATGVTHSYFGREDWMPLAPGLKTIEDAIEIRKRVLLSFEHAESEPDGARRKKLLRFAIVGGGPTGVELAGTLAELARATLAGEYRHFSAADAEIHLFEGGDRILSSFHERTSRYAVRALTSLGVTVHTSTRVVDVSRDGLVFIDDGVETVMEAATVIWAAGVRASEMAKVLAERCGAELDRSGRVVVTPFLTLPGRDEIFVLGDLAAVKRENAPPFPGLAPVAMQQGKYAAKAIALRLKGKAAKPFWYFDKGNMAVIGRGRAVAEAMGIRLTGFFAWLAWAVVHIYFLIEFENKIVVFWHWVWNYITNKRGSRIISGSFNPSAEQTQNEAPAE